jgi:hypothetical protein
MRLNAVAGKNSMFKIVTLAASLLFVAGTFGAKRATFFNTGVDQYGAPLRDGQIDVHYTLSFSDPFQYKDLTRPVEGQTAAVAPAAGWLGWREDKSGFSRWISIPSADPPSYAAPGFYQFRTTFTLTGANLSNFSLSGRWAIDNSAAGIYLNGHLVGSQTSVGFSDWTPLTIGPSSHFNINNTLDFVVQNAGSTGTNPMGLRVELAEDVPSSSSPLLIGAAVMVLVVAAALLFVLRRGKGAPGGVA